MGANSDPNALEQQEPCNPDVLSLPSLRLKATSFPKNNSNAYKGYTGDKVKGKAAQSCPTFCDPMHCIYTVHGILQARILEFVVVPFSRGSYKPRDQTQVSHTAGKFFTIWATREAQKETKRDTDVWTTQNQSTLAPPRTDSNQLLSPSLLPSVNLNCFCQCFTMLQERSKFQMILWNLPAFKYWKLFFKVLKHCSEQI